MSQLTLNLPGSLRLALERQAEREGVSLQDYIVHFLSSLASQKITFAEMVTRHPQDQAEAVLQDLLSAREDSF